MEAAGRTWRRWLWRRRSRHGRRIRRSRVCDGPFRWPRPRDKPRQVRWPRVRDGGQHRKDGNERTLCRQPSLGGAILLHMKVEEIAEAIAKLPPDQLTR